MEWYVIGYKCKTTKINHFTQSDSENFAAKFDFTPIQLGQRSCVANTHRQQRNVHILWKQHN